MSTKTRLPTPKEAQHPTPVDPNNVRPTVSSEGNAITYDMSKPVYMVTKKMDGKVTIPTYEEIPKVQGYFKNIENPGHAATFPFRKGWKGPIRYFTLEENKLLTIPVTLCDALNNECAYIEEKWVTPGGDSTSRPIMDMRGGYTPSHLQKEVKTRTNRFQFIISHNLEYKPQIQAVG